MWQSGPQMGCAESLDNLANSVPDFDGAMKSSCRLSTKLGTLPTLLLTIAG